MPGKSRLTLLVPGLFGPFQGFESGMLDGLAIPGLNGLLAGSRRESAGKSALEAACAAFGLLPARGRDLPLAACGRFAFAGERPDGWWIGADPVHLRPDQSRLVLFDARTLDVTAEEAAALVSTLNATFGHDGLHFEAGAGARWYLHARDHTRVATTPVAEVAGRDIDPCLPRGPDAPYWHRLMNEIQMLLHDHPVNRTRETDGRPAINSLWFSGGGVLPSSLASDYDRLWSDDPVLTGVARLAGVEQAEVPHGAAALPGTGTDHLVLLEDLAEPVAYGDLPVWSERLERLDVAWFQPLLEDFRRRALNELVVEAAPGPRFAARRGWWRRWPRVADRLADLMMRTG